MLREPLQISNPELMSTGRLSWRKLKIGIGELMIQLPARDYSERGFGVCGTVSFKWFFRIPLNSIVISAGNLTGLAVQYFILSHTAICRMFSHSVESLWQVSSWHVLPNSFHKYMGQESSYQSIFGLHLAEEGSNWISSCPGKDACPGFWVGSAVRCLEICHCCCQNLQEIPYTWVPASNDFSRKEEL